MSKELELHSNFNQINSLHRLLANVSHMHGCLQYTFCELTIVHQLWNNHDHASVLYLKNLDCEHFMN